MSLSAKDWLVEWFVKHGDLSEDEVKKSVSENYFSKGWIDSLSFITLVSEIEDAFDIHFSNEEFQNRSFATIEGLAAAISERTHGNK